MEWDLLVKAGMGLISILLAANAFFIVRLVKTIDKSNERSENLEKQMASVMEKVAQLPDLYLRIVTLEKQVAVFEYVMKVKDSQ